jgi:hypothetical protein
MASMPHNLVMKLHYAAILILVLIGVDWFTIETEDVCDD